MVQLRESWMTCSWSHRKVVSKLVSYVDSLESCKIIRSNGKEVLKRPRNLFVSHTYIHVYINTILSTAIENIDENESWWHSCSRSCTFAFVRGNSLRDLIRQFRQRDGVTIYTVGISIVGISITERIFDENGCGIGWTALMNPQHRWDPRSGETSVSKIIVPWYQMRRLL